MISTRLLTSTDNTPTSACFRASTINSTGKRFLHNESPFISDWIRRKLSLNMHQKRGCPSLLNVTVLFIKEGMKEEFIWKGDKNLLRMAKYLATSKPEEKLERNDSDRWLPINVPSFQPSMLCL